MPGDAPLRVVLIAPHLPVPEVREIEHSLRAMQQVVGGYIELVPLDGQPGCALIVNEDGEGLGLPLCVEIPGRAPLVPEGWEVIAKPDDMPASGELGVHRVRGACLIVGVDDLAGEFAPLTEARAAELLQLARSWRRYPPPEAVQP